MVDFVQPFLDQWDQSETSDPYTGNQTAGTFEDNVPATVGATTSWNNLTQAELSNDGSTDAAVSGNNTSVFPFIRASNFGFSIPTGATILGIEVVVGWADSSSSFIEDELRLAWGASAASQSTNNNFDGVSALPVAGTEVTYGSPTDLWGESSATLLAQVNDTDFGVILKVDRTGASTFACGIDYLQMRVHYSLATAPTSNARVTQTYAETMVSQGAEDARVSQVYAETLTAHSAEDARVTQVYAEVLIEPSSPAASSNTPRVIVVT